MVPSLMPEAMLTALVYLHLRRQLPVDVRAPGARICGIMTLHLLPVHAASSRYPGD